MACREARGRSTRVNAPAAFVRAMRGAPGPGQYRRALPSLRVYLCGVRWRGAKQPAYPYKPFARRRWPWKGEVAPWLGITAARAMGKPIARSTATSAMAPAGRWAERKAPPRELPHRPVKPAGHQERPIPWPATKHFEQRRDASVRGRFSLSPDHAPSGAARLRRRVAEPSREGAALGRRSSRRPQFGRRLLRP
jgi:hypothetical protein